MPQSGHSWCGRRASPHRPAPAAPPADDGCHAASVPLALLGALRPTDAPGAPSPSLSDRCASLSSHFPSTTIKEPFTLVVATASTMTSTEPNGTSAPLLSISYECLLFDAAVQSFLPQVLQTCGGRAESS